jgi:hypothetical protein
VSWLPVRVWFVPSEADAEVLVAEGISRGCIWTARELLDLLAAGITREEVRLVAVTKLEFGGSVVAVQPRAHREGCDCATCVPPDPLLPLLGAGDPPAAGDRWVGDPTLGANPAPDQASAGSSGVHPANEPPSTAAGGGA